MRSLILAATLLATAACGGDASVERAQGGEVTDTESILPFALIVGTGDLAGTVKVSDEGTGIATDAAWQWASVTKQFVALLIVQDVEAGRLSLDDRIGTYLPDFGSGPRADITIEQLLRHFSGLGEPRGLPKTDEVVPLDYCDVPMRDTPGSGFTYTNCDTIVAAAVVEAVNEKPWQELLQERILDPAGMADTGVLLAPVSDGSVVTSGRPHLYGASGAMYGTPHDLLKFNAALMSGTLVSEAGLEMLWDGDPKRGFVALGAWEYASPLAGCEGSVRLVERHGEIGGIQVRSILAPEIGRSLVAFTRERSADFGAIWSGAGVSYTLASQAFCDG